VDPAKLQGLVDELVNCAARVRADELGDQQARSRMARTIEDAARILESVRRPHS
jgi:hypothetical protein